MPYVDSAIKTFKKLKAQLNNECKISDCYQFKIPNLKVGSVDSLMSLSDDIVKWDSTLESIAMKVLKNLTEVDTSINIDEFVPEIILQEDNKGNFYF